jgi:hypothetical protein
MTSTSDGTSGATAPRWATPDADWDEQLRRHPDEGTTDYVHGTEHEIECSGKPHEGECFERDADNFVRCAWCDKTVHVDARVDHLRVAHGLATGTETTDG